MSRHAAADEESLVAVTLKLVAHRVGEFPGVQRNDYATGKPEATKQRSNEVERKIARFDAEDRREERK